MKRVRDAIRLAVVVLTGVLSRRPVRPLADEAHRRLPGDELLPGAKGRWTHGITIRDRPLDIWPWLVQMGCRRAGWYSYDGLDNGGLPSAKRIIPELQQVEVGDIFPWTPTADDGFVAGSLFLVASHWANPTYTTAPPSAESETPRRVEVTTPAGARPRRVPGSFLGLSTEYWAVPEWQRQGSVLARVLALLRVPGDGPMVLRIGGDSANEAL